MTAPYRTSEDSLRAEVDRLTPSEHDEARSLARLTPHRGERVTLAAMHDGRVEHRGVVARCWRWMRPAVALPGGGRLLPGQASRMDVVLDDGRTVTLDVRDPARLWFIAAYDRPAKGTP